MITNLDPQYPVFSNFRVRSTSGTTHSVEVRNVRDRYFACDCVGSRNGLSTCKHAEAVFLHLETRYRRLLRAAAAAASERIDIVPDRARDTLRAINGGGPLPALLAGWFDDDGWLMSDASEDILETLAQLREGGLSNLRISQEVAPWLESRRRGQVNSNKPRARALTARLADSSSEPFIPRRML